jgi:hypothetical protein
MYTSTIAQSPLNVIECLTDWNGTLVQIGEQHNSAEFGQLFIDQMPLPEPIFPVSLRRNIVGIDERFETEVEDKYNSLYLEVRKCSYLGESLNRVHAIDFHTDRNRYFALSLGRLINAKSGAYISELPNFLSITLKPFEWDYKIRTRMKI